MKINSYSENVFFKSVENQQNYDTIKSTKEQASVATNVTTCEEGVVLE